MILRNPRCQTAEVGEKLSFRTFSLILEYFRDHPLSVRLFVAPIESLCEQVEILAIVVVQEMAHKQLVSWFAEQKVLQQQTNLIEIDVLAFVELGRKTG